MAVNRQALDAAVRAFQRDNPERGYCTCFGCVATINANYNAIIHGKDWPPAPEPEASPGRVLHEAAGQLRDEP